MFDYAKLQRILGETTRQLRKGEVLVGDPAMVDWARANDPCAAPPGGVLEIYAMPPASEATGLQMVDMHFVVIGVDAVAAEARRADFIELLDSYPEPEELAGGPSYITMGATIGDQGAAFQIFALGKVLGLWDVITPELLGVTGDAADQMAGGGFIMCTGYRSKADQADA